MQRIPVTSSNLKDVGYDSQTFTLEIGFLNGRVYQYFNVPEARYDGLMNASSKGSYFDAYIKKGGHRYNQVR